MLLLAGRTEMLVVPTGTGGVLYCPQFLHPIVFDPQFRNVTGEYCADLLHIYVLSSFLSTGYADDIMFRLASMANGIPVVLGCRSGCPMDVGALVTNHRVKLRLQRESQPVDRVGGTGKSEKLSVAYLLTMHANSHYLRTNNATLADTLTAAFEYFNPTAARTLRAESLYGINRRGNDVQWRAALAYLRNNGILPDFQDLLRVHFYEREESCYSSNKTTNIACAMYVCKDRHIM